ncbi:MAG: hypothetical protein ACR2FY_15680 [Pirellulaceae bacterium]
MDFKIEVPDEVIAVLAVVGFVTFFAAILAWGVGDSQKRGQAGCLFLILFLFFGPLAVLVWLLVRPAKTLVQRLNENYSCADEALAAASSLEQLGEWEHAIGLYESAAYRWPDQKGYIAECLNRIKEKQSPG